MKLLIISHTEHYKNEKGVLVGWGSTITEINHLASIFDEIYHIAVFKPIKAPKSSSPYTLDNIHFIALPSTGGQTWQQKFDIIWNAPSTIYKVFKTLKKVDIFQLRTPTGIGVYLIPLLTLFSRKKGWFKYAGNWVQEKAPLGYNIQRWFLKHQRRKVTINGHWDALKQPSHCFTFENPCLLEKDRIIGKEFIANKRFNAPYTLCFVGRLEDEKGVLRIIDAISQLNNKSLIKKIHMVGDGPKFEEYKTLVKATGVSFEFHGFLGNKEVFEIYKQSHFFLLPSSASEGFPKVIAEAMNYGCIPIVSNVSAIGQYVINDKNGFIVTPNTSNELKIMLEIIIELPSGLLGIMASNGYETVSNFTYEYYIDQIKNQIVLI